MTFVQSLRVRRMEAALKEPSDVSAELVGFGRPIRCPNLALMLLRIATSELIKVEIADGSARADDGVLVAVATGVPRAALPRSATMVACAAPVRAAVRRQW